MAEHGNLRSGLRAGLAAFSSGDMEAMNEFIPADAVWHVTGNSTLSGDYKGRDAVYGYFGKLMEITGGTFKATLLFVLADDDHSMAMQRSEATVNGKAGLVDRCTHRSGGERRSGRDVDLLRGRHDSQLTPRADPRLARSTASSCTRSA